MSTSPRDAADGASEGPAPDARDTGRPPGRSWPPEPAGLGPCLLAALDTARDALFVVDDRGGVLAWNRRAERLFDLEGGDAVGRALTEVVLPERLRDGAEDLVVPAAHDDAGTGTGRQQGFLALHRTGAEFPALSLLAPLDDFPGRHVLWIWPTDAAMAGDDPSVTWRTDAERIGAVGHYTWWPRSGHLQWSPRLFDILGRDPEEGDPSIDDFAAQVHPADHHLAGPEAGAFESAHFEFRLIRLDGVVRRIEASRRVTRDADGATERVDGEMRDVTDHLQAVAVLAAHRAMHDVLVAWESCAESVGSLLRRLAVALGSPAAGLYVPAADGTGLRCRGYWTEPGDDELDDFALRSFAGMRPPGPMVDLARREAVVVLLEDLPDEARQDPAVVGNDFGSAVTIPAVHDREVLAVLELHWFDRRAFDPIARRALALIGAQIGAFLDRRRGDLHPGALTAREIEVLQLASDGQGVEQIAAELLVATGTVRTHFKNIYDRLGVRDRAAAVAEGLRLGLLR